MHDRHGLRSVQVVVDGIQEGLFELGSSFGSRVVGGKFRIKIIQSILRTLQTFPAEIKFGAVMRGKNQISESQGIESFVDYSLEGDKIAFGFAHTAFTDQQVFSV